MKKRATSPACSPNSRQRDVLFIDEIHRLQTALEEILYPAMEDFRIDLISTRARRARPSVSLNRFTLIGATTRAGLMMAPLRSRFGIVHRLDFYSPEDLQNRAALRKNSWHHDGRAGAAEIARRSRGTPRSPIACCAASAISPKCAPRATSRSVLRATRSRCSALTSTASTKSTAT